MWRRVVTFPGLRGARGIRCLLRGAVAIGYALRGADEE